MNQKSSLKEIYLDLNYDKDVYDLSEIELCLKEQYGISFKTHKIGFYIAIGIPIKFNNGQTLEKI